MILYVRNQLNSPPKSTSLTISSEQQGQISGMLVFEDFLRRFGVPDETVATGYSIPATRSSILVSLMSIGSLLGALSGAYTSDWWGRRKSLTFGVFLFIIGNVIQITSMQSWIHMMMGRFVAGIGVGNLSVGEFADRIVFILESSPF